MLEQSFNWCLGFIFRIILDKNPCKMFPNNSQNYGSSCTEDNINEASLALSTLPLENQAMKNKNFHSVVH